LKLLVTGGAGFIGSNFVRMSLSNSLSDRIESITVIDALTYAGNLENLSSVIGNEKFNFVHGDIRDKSLVDKLVKDSEVVVNFAAESHVDRSISSASTFVETNVFGVLNLLEAASKYKIERFVQISTDEVYGSIENGTWDEDCPLLPNSPYAASKASADLLCRAFYQTHGVPIIITRCSNNYGPFQYPEKLIPLFVTNLIEGRKVPLYGNGENVREWIHVDDHCEGIWSVIDRGTPGEIYNLSTEVETKNIEITNEIFRILEINDDLIDWVPDRLGHDKRYALDCGKAKTRLAFTPKISFQEGLGLTINWYRLNETWWRPLKSIQS
jgi:dTDP-glucose 4,6-dehydratase